MTEPKTFSRNAFKYLVKKKIRKAAIAGLKEIQETHICSKTKKTEKNELKMQEFLPGSRLIMPFWNYQSNVDSMAIS